jgi:hypothetical protein
VISRNTKGGSITVPLTSCLTYLDKPVLQIKTIIVSCHNSKPVKQEVNGTVILPPLVFPCDMFRKIPAERKMLLNQPKEAEMSENMKEGSVM